MALKDVFGVYAAENAHINPFIIKTVEEATELGRVVDFIAANISVSADTKRQIIIETDVIKRCDILITRLAEDVQICRVRNEYKEQVQQKVDKNQKEYYLKAVSYTHLRRNVLWNDDVRPDGHERRV